MGDESRLDTGRLAVTSWPLACPSKNEEKILSITCGNSHLHWACHTGTSTDLMPSLFWRTPVVSDEEMENSDHCAVIERYLPKQAHAVLFGSEDAPAVKAQAAKAASQRRIPALGVYVVSTNETNEKGIEYLFRDIPSRLFKFKASDFFTKEQGAYDGIGVDRVATLKAAVSNYSPPALVIDGGTALTYTAADKDGNIMGGGITPGLASKFRSLLDYTGALPHVDHDEVRQIVKEAEEQKKPLPLFATKTKEAMVGAVLTETARLLCSMIKQHLAQVNVSTSKEPTSDPSNSEPTTSKVCVTGGDGDILAKLLEPQHSHIIPEEPGTTFDFMKNVEIQKHKHLQHYGIAAALVEKTRSFEVAFANDKDQQIREELKGQRVAKRFFIRSQKAEGGNIFRGSIAAVTRGATLEEDWYFVIYDDGDTEHLTLTDLYDAMVLYTTVGEADQTQNGAKIEQAKAAAKTLVDKSNKIKAHSSKPVEQPAAKKSNPVGRPQGSTGKRQASEIETPKPAKKKAKLPTPKKNDPISYVKTRIAKMFGNDCFFGTVTSYDPTSKLWHIVYDDDDEEDYDDSDMKEAKSLYKKRGKEDPSPKTQSTTNGSGGSLAVASVGDSKPAPA